MISTFIPNQILIQIAAVKPPSDGKCEDLLYWAHSKTGRFTSKSAYLFLNNSNCSKDAHFWKLIWQWKGPQRVKIFLWLVMHGKIKTREELFKRHIVDKMNCERCGHERENVMHALRDCFVAKRIWNCLIPVNFRHHFFSFNLRDWLCFNLGKTGINEVGDECACLFGVAIWKIWFWRNQFLFSQKSPCCNHVVAEIKSWAQDIQNARSTLSFGQSNKIIKDVRWQAPPESFFKLNTDGSRLKNGLASAGGLVRDCSRKWQFGFGMNIGFGSVTIAELWGLFQGLNIAWDRGIRYLIVEVDRQCVSQLISSTRLMPNAHFSLITAIKELMNRQWLITIKHIYREANFAADSMAKLAGSLPLGLHVFENPPEGLGYWLCNDIYGTSFLCSVLT
ncbi:putative ribonuclease H protein [Citrus sinensis]|uniref:Ribonuclease H protein n=1 Tax=Citrus sinensis TaxID=2711 RepID=A0ACB8LC92_CITSI|nr:putative ribonuclease H protein [Citrus sinensis]